MDQQLSKNLPNGAREIVFEHHWREDFVGEALTIRVGAEQIIERIEFYSSEFGVVRWHQNSGLGNGRGWEAEDAASDDSLSDKFPCSFLNGVVHDNQTRAIIESVLGHPNLANLVPVIRSALTDPETEHEIPANLS